MPIFTTHVTLDDIASISLRTDLGDDTPVHVATAEARAAGYEAICVPLTNEKWETRWKGISCRGLEVEACLFRDEVTITRLDEAEGIVALVSDWLELDAADDWVRHDSEIALQQELAYASYLNVQSVILRPRATGHISRLLHTDSHLRPCRLTHPPSPTRSPVESPVSVASPEPPITTWEMWDTIRSICDYNTRLTLTLDLTPPLPLVLSILSQWSAEPVRHIFLPTSTFIANAKGYPVLPKGTQSFIRDIMKLQPNVILSGTMSGRHHKGGEPAYAQYIRHLEKTSPSVKAAHTAGTVENFAQGYQDYLQAPLQPLMDNLQSITYQTFEQDPVKYRNYEEAVFMALLEWPRPGKITICVAGAGRGPLVARCLSALQRSKREAFVYAVEKNPNAYVTLQERDRREWGDKVKLLFGDMRTLEVPEKVDILVSELLGSFGDNELSPECLDGAMRFLKSDGISIPSSYTGILRLSLPRNSSMKHGLQKTRRLRRRHSCHVPCNQLPERRRCWRQRELREAVLDENGLPLTNSHNTDL
ncbi:Protein arginine N-methyltransferase 5 [Grifola frondosa]|uniref:Protein arginine N-methyltransferase 5 n=1 Tax=Grifola frondosa TaxID=5627 RepID=A0A1C7M5L0_GRIFR|nr:Protein arginine N-methyltransferase 5 [Grifola frondosa]